tara:strand:- start:1211 stop:2437 length:1227 start_codon:yes stop_codon:yes gene_type:complete
MKIKFCRSCKSNNIKKVFDLGKQKLSGVFPKNKNQDHLPSGSLSMVFCNTCKLLQLENSFDPNAMYGDNYGYMSSLNSSMLKHLYNKSCNLKKIVELSVGDAVVDIGSNDGSFLNFFSNKQVLIGIDPTIKKLGKFYRKDIIKISNFFSKELFHKNYDKKVKLVTSISMFYDLENPIKFSEDIYEILDKDGVWHLEQSYMPMMLKNNSYDTICHEHLEYYSLKSIKYIFDKVGFKIVDLQFNEINGGSFALTVAKKNSKKFSEEKRLVNWLLNKERLFNYNSIKTFKDFYENIKKHKKIFRDLILNLKESKKKILGYGASTKGNVILQYCNLNSTHIPFIAEVNKFKFNRYTPGSNIKIISEKKAQAMNPDYFLVLPWHFKNHIIKREFKFIKNNGKLIFPLPDIDII